MRGPAARRPGRRHRPILPPDVREGARMAPVEAHPARRGRPPDGHPRAARHRRGGGEADAFRLRPGLRPVREPAAELEADTPEGPHALPPTPIGAIRDPTTMPGGRIPPAASPAPPPHAPPRPRVSARRAGARREAAGPVRPPAARPGRGGSRGKGDREHDREDVAHHGDAGTPAPAASPTDIAPASVERSRTSSGHVTNESPDLSWRSGAPMGRVRRHARAPSPSSSPHLAPRTRPGDAVTGRGRSAFVDPIGGEGCGRVAGPRRRGSPDDDRTAIPLRGPRPSCRPTPGPGLRSPHAPLRPRRGKPSGRVVGHAVAPSIAGGIRQQADFGAARHRRGNGDGPAAR